MPFLIQYLLKLSISLAVVFLFYQLLLRRLTFYNWNRWYLIGYSVLSFFIPFINIAPFVENKNLDHVEAINYIPVINNYIVVPSNAAPDIKSHIPNQWDIFLFLIFLGSCIMLIRFIIHFFSLQKIKKNSVVISTGGDASIYQVNENIIPFSFGNAIYINQQLHTEKEFEEIILHEYVHVKQKHTVDILAGELLCIINWFNPFAWLLRHAIRQNLEFIADDIVLKNGLDRKAYQYHLLKVVGAPEYRIANSFNFSSLKKRIAMMNKLKSARLQLIKFLFVLPLIAVLLVAFRDKYKNVFEKKSSFCTIKGIIIDASTNSPLSNVIVKETNSGLTATTNETGFYSLKIFLKKDSLSLHFELRKKGYEDGAYGYNYPGNYKGFINVLAMFDTAAKYVHKVMMFMPGGKTFKTDPESNDVMRLYEETVKENKAGNSFLEFYDSHPGLTFYTAEDKTKQIVILNDGAVEKYGYPNGLTIADMEKKYGPLPDMFTNPKYGGGKEYVAKWQKISEEAEKKFRTTNPGVKQIIFPGDSRAIVILKDGSKPRWYDMDNAVPEERPAFEKLYGPLTGIVPPPANYGNGFHYDQQFKDWVIEGIQFFGFASLDLDKENAITHFKGDGILKIDDPAVAKALILYNNKEYDAASFNRQFGNIDRKFSDVIIYENKSAFDKFGEKGRHGVIVICDNSKKQITSEGGHIKSDTIPANVTITGKDIDKALWVIDGIEIPSGINWANLINPSAIKSMSVLKGNSAFEKYGDKGKNGVIEITTNKQGKNKLDSVLQMPQVVHIDNISGENKPIYIVDGKEVPGIKDLSPDQIESISVLKDSTATKQYGAKGKNGVILIKTKKQQTIDSPRVNTFSSQNNLWVDGHFNFQSPKPFTIFPDNYKTGKDTVTITADTIVYDKNGLQFSGTVTIKDDEISTVTGNISFNKKDKLPLIFYNGKQVDKLKGFKVLNGHYKLVSLNTKTAIEKYGNKGIDGAIEISSL